MKKKFIENKKFRLMAVFLITVFIVGGFSFAWFWLRESQTIDMSVSNFKAEPVCYFEGKENEHLTGLIELSTNEEDPNYIGNFRVKVKYSGDGAGYLRVRMVHKFTTGTSDIAVQHPAKIPYATAKGMNEDGTTEVNLWHDNRSKDYCYYYQGTDKDKGRLDADSDEKVKSVQLITGLSKEASEMIAGFAEADAVIKVAVEADMVQINRYPQIWGDLPWEIKN